MKTPSSHLFDLIKSLDKSEKRYFRIFTSKEVNNDSTLFIKLYDLIEKQAEASDIYNEDEIKKQLAGSKLLKQFPFYKNYLYNILLQSLRHYHASTSTDAFLKNKTQEINILYDKGLFAQCDSLIKDTKKVANKYDRKLILLELYEWEALVKNVMSDTKGLDEYLKKGHAEQLELLELEKAFVELTKFVYQASNDAQIKAGENIPAMFTLEDVDKVYSKIQKSNRLNFMPVFYYNLTKASYYLFTGKLDKDHEFLKKNFEHLGQQKHISNEMPHLTFFSIFNYALSCSFINLNDEALEVIELLRKKPNEYFKKRSKYLEANIFMYTYALELQIRMSRENYSGSVEMETIIKNGVNEHSYVINTANKLVIYSLMAMVLFADKKFKNALNWINEIINFSDDNIRMDIHCNARIMNMMLHYQIGNYDYLKNLYRSTVRYLKKNHHFTALEKRLLDFISNELPSMNKEDKNAAFVKLGKELEPLMNEKSARKELYYKNINSWIKNNSF